MVDKPQINVRVTPELKREIQAIARDAGVTMSAWVVMTLRAAVRGWDAGLTRTRGKRKPARGSRYASGYPRSKPCYVCGQAHDPIEHPTEDSATVAALAEE